MDTDDKQLDYSNTIIYKIFCKDTNIKDLYVGHTIDFVQRKKAHQYSCNTECVNNPCKLYDTINKNGGWNNWRMEIIYFFNCENKIEALKKEQEYYEMLGANLNSIEPFTMKSCIVKKERKHKSDGSDQSQNKYCCDLCGVKTNHKAHYETHLLTDKHNKKIKYFIKFNKEINISHHECNCGKIYNNRKSLFSHKKKCLYKEKEDKHDAEIVNQPSLDPDIVKELINQNQSILLENQEFKKIIMELVSINKM